MIANGLAAKFFTNFLLVLFLCENKPGEIVYFIPEQTKFCYLISDGIHSL